MAVKRKPDWYDMDESMYRASRVCRVLGNPTAFKILAEIRRLGEATPTELAPLLDRSVAGTSIALKTLRETDLVRYIRKGKNAIYRIKGPEVEKLLDSLSSFVDGVRRRAR